MKFCTVFTSNSTYQEQLRCEKVVLLLQPRQLLSEIRESVSDAATIGVDPRVQMPQREEAAVVDEDLRPGPPCLEWLHGHYPYRNPALVCRSLHERT